MAKNENDNMWKKLDTYKGRLEYSGSRFILVISFVLFPETRNSTIFDTYKNTEIIA